MKGYFKTPKKIAFIHEENNHLTGGRYYSWFIIAALCEMGHDVTVYTNRRNTFMNEMAYYKRPRIVISTLSAVRLAAINVLADIYIGSPIQGATAAARLGKKYNKPAFALVFDPFPAMQKYLGKSMYSGWDNLIPLLKETDIEIFSLCKAMSEYIYKWLNKKKDKVHEVYPCINSRALDKKERNYEREDYVVFVSRLVRSKRFEDVLTAVKRTDMRLKVISSISGIPYKQIVHAQGMTDRVDFHWKIPDNEKFDIIAKSKAIINGSIFEGWGIYVTEAIATGTPFVGYDYPTFREIRDFSKADNIYLAQPKNVNDLTRKLRRALKEKKYREFNKAFHFESMVKTIQKI